MTTLKEALEATYRTRWSKGRDAGKSTLSQAQQAAWSIVHHLIPTAMPHTGSYLDMVTVEGVTDPVVRAVTAKWYSDGLAPATINKRLGALSAMGITVPGYERIKPSLKWWLRPEEEVRATAWLVAGEQGRVADIIEWTTRTGLRIEESLRLRKADFVFLKGVPIAVTVPGLKTASSQATLPLATEASDIAKRRFGYGYEHMWGGMGYAELELAWRDLRTAMRWEGNGVTLKALRRSAARYLHVDCGMPLDMVRHYLRHEDIETTMGYLRLTGGYEQQEMARYLK